jgi:ADP-heptose:LPS heptosyltransferase
MGERIAVGLASGLGNCVFMLPAIKALHSMGHDVALYVDTDFPTADLWKRCIYASAVFEKSQNLEGRLAVAGEYQPACWSQLTLHQRFYLKQIYACVWQSNMRIAHGFGYSDTAPDVSDWCRDLDRSKRWDFGIVPGCKAGIWIRKRWPQMKTVSRDLRRKGYSVAVFGLPGDDMEEIPGEKFDTAGKLAQLPDLLAGCRVIISTDSGVGHLASSLGIPVVMLYTATSSDKADPVGRQKIKIRPRISCYPCVSTPQWHICKEWKCQMGIDQSEVVNAAELLIKGSENHGI